MRLFAAFAAMDAVGCAGGYAFAHTGPFAGAAVLVAAAGLMGGTVALLARYC